MDVGAENINKKLRSELKVLAESGTPGDHVFNIYANILVYAQSFERSELHRSMMVIPSWHHRNSYYKPGNRDINAFAQPYTFYQYQPLGVFTTLNAHLVEATLRLAKFESEAFFFLTRYLTLSKLPVLHASKRGDLSATTLIGTKLYCHCPRHLDSLFSRPRIRSQAGGGGGGRSSGQFRDFRVRSHLHLPAWTTKSICHVP